MSRLSFRLILLCIGALTAQNGHGFVDAVGPPPRTRVGKVILVDRRGLAGGHPAHMREVTMNLLTVNERLMYLAFNLDRETFHIDGAEWGDATGSLQEVVVQLNNELDSTGADESDDPLIVYFDFKSSRRHASEAAFSMSSERASTIGRTHTSPSGSSTSSRQGGGVSGQPNPFSAEHISSILAKINEEQSTDVNALPHALESMLAKVRAMQLPANPVGLHNFLPTGPGIDPAAAYAASGADVKGGKKP